MPLQNLSKSERTKKSLKSALIDLCSKKNYHEITIAEICGQANTYRSTFYRYYDTKDDMLREIEKDYIQDTRDLTPSLSSLSPPISKDVYDVLLQEMKEDMTYHRKHRKLCRFLLSPSGDPFFYHKMIESVAQTAEKHLTAGEGKKGFLQNYQLHYLASGFVATIHEWLKKDDCTPEEIAGFLLDMVLKIKA